MADIAKIISRVRAMIDDYGTPYRDVLTGTGDLDEYDLSESNVTVDRVSQISGGTITDLQAGRNYTVDQHQGRIIFRGGVGTLPLGATVIVEGTARGMLTDEDLAQHVRDAQLWHCGNRTITTRYRSKEGFIRYSDEPLTLDNLPEIEELPLALLAAVNALWQVATSTATEPDIQTAEGTHISRSQVYEQTMDQITALTNRYKELCEQLNVGMYRIEISTLRRVSQTTGRYIPGYSPREFDDASYPARQLPPIDRHHEDPSGIPSPILPGLTG
ncbi:hypothetical protein [Streptomyces sp. UNOC14_S4]|uniref:hypothetical protein n=1 Tax=Streptomyces sp. UNOC14_S4 TaxID=2872340 RepID=UPI001E4F70F8|nr:hypothetical protein [Streptomyces sp. UNOC14_S4]MCC3766045.1 hypothetical protein [Streptomyces sp. UNOC14_S4]